MSSTRLGYYVTNDAVFFKTNKDFASANQPFHVTVCDVSAINRDELDSYSMSKSDAFVLSKVLNCKVLVRTISSSFREIKA
jgi:hypothetical protein